MAKTSASSKKSSASIRRGKASASRPSAKLKRTKKIVKPSKAPAAPKVAPAVIKTRVETKTRVEAMPRKAELPSRKKTSHGSQRHEPLPPIGGGMIEAPVPTDGKPRKNQAGLTSRELDHYRELLWSKRRELVGDMSSMEREALRSSGGTNLSNLPIHMADMGTDNYEQEFTLGLVEKERVLLREINTALAKIQNGSFGICEGTGKPIAKPRLEAQPWAKYSIEHARALEKRMLR